MVVVVMEGVVVVVMVGVVVVVVGEALTVNLPSMSCIISCGMIEAHHFVLETHLVDGLVLPDVIPDRLKYED